MTDFDNGFGLGASIGMGIVALWIVAAPQRYVQCLDRATFRYVWLLIALRSALARLGGRAPSARDGDAVAMMRARVDSAIARRRDPQLDSDARGLGAVILACSALALVWPHALVALASLTMAALAAFILRLESRRPDEASRRAAALRPRPPLDAALAVAIGVAGVLVAGALGLAAFGVRIGGRADLAIAATFGIVMLALALRLARRPATLFANDVAIEAYVDEQFRVTRVAYLLALSLFPIAIAMMRTANVGADGAVLRATYEAGFGIVLIAWFASGLRAPQTAGT